MNPGRLLLLLATSLPAILVDEGVVRPFVAPAVRGAGRSWRRSFVAPLVRLPSTPGGLPLMAAVLTAFSLTHATGTLGLRRRRPATTPRTHRHRRYSLAFAARIAACVASAIDQVDAVASNDRRKGRQPQVEAS